MTPAERKAKERQRRRDAGETLLQVWVKPEDMQAVKNAIAEATRLPGKPADDRIKP
jgi:hypothetical protein